MLTLEHVPAKSKRIDRDCCPECNSLQLEYRKRWVHCQHCGANFPSPAKVKPTVPAVERPVVSLERAAPVYYRGLRWGIFADVDG